MKLTGACPPAASGRLVAAGVSFGVGGQGHCQGAPGLGSSATHRRRLQRARRLQALLATELLWVLNKGLGVKGDDYEEYEEGNKFDLSEMLLGTFAVECVRSGLVGDHYEEYEEENKFDFSEMLMGTVGVECVRGGLFGDNVSEESEEDYHGECIDEGEEEEEEEESEADSEVEPDAAQPLDLIYDTLEANGSGMKRKELEEACLHCIDKNTFCKALEMWQSLGVVKLKKDDMVVLDTG